MVNSAHDEYWQVFAQSAEPLIDGKVSANFKEVDTVLGHVHVWMWRTNKEIREILIQKRAHTVRYPGMWDISVAGHINYQESAIDAAIREAYEELGLTLRSDNLYLIQVRRSLTTGSFQWIYLYKLSNDIELLPSEKEVSEVKWVSLDQFRTIIEEPATYGQLDKGRDYFGALLDALESVK